MRTARRYCRAVLFIVTLKRTAIAARSIRRERSAVLVFRSHLPRLAGLHLPHVRRHCGSPIPLFAFETWTAPGAVETGRMRTVFPAGQQKTGSSRDKTARMGRCSAALRPHFF